MSQSDDDIFKAMMADVTPMSFEQRAELKAEKAEASVVKTRREAATAEKLAEHNALSGEFIEPVDPLAELSYQRAGMQHGVVKKLRLGKYPIEARLDLHRHTVEQARRALYQFVQDCMANDIRCALVTHGKGEDRQPQPGLLKSCVAHWLPQLESVLAFHTAQRHHGGFGATYIMLKKSEKKRLENLERHQKRH